MSHPLLAKMHDVLLKIKNALMATPYTEDVKGIIRTIEQVYVKTANGTFESSASEGTNDDENVSYSLRQKPEPEKKGTGYKVFVLGKDGKLYPPMVANPNGAATPVGVWLDADAAPVAGESKTGRPQVKQGGKGTQGGSGKLAYRPGWHLGVIPYAIQFNRKDAEGNKTLFPKNFVFAEVEYAADKDYQDEAHAEGINSNGKYQHSLAGLKHLPTDGYYMYRTNPNPETDPWVITGAMKVNRLLTRAEQADIVRNAGREPQKIQEGDIVTDDVVNSINQEIAAAPKFSLKVYHGSGADFTEFDFDHMGEGAGSQSFGWGGYVTSSKKIGKSYANLVDANAPHQDVEYVGNNAHEYTDVVAGLFNGGQRDYDDVKEFLQNGYNTDKENARKKQMLEWFESTKPSDWKSVNDGKRNLYEVDIPDDNGSNYLEWEKKPSDEVATKIIDGIYGLDDKTLDDMAARDIVFRTLMYDYIKNADKEQMIPILVKTNGLTRNTVYDNGNVEDDIRFVYNRLSNWMGSPKAASKFLSSLGFTGIKYPAGTIYGGAEEGDVNYVIFKPEDMQIVEHEKFSVKKKIFDPREISDTEKQRRGDMLIHATPVDVAKDQIIKTDNLSARKVAEQWWRENIGSPLYYETEIGKVEINENSIQSSLAHRYGQAKLDAITSLKDGFNNAVYLGTIPDFVRTRDDVQNHYFAYPINYDGKRCYVFCRAMEDANKNSLYVHEVFIADNIQKEGNTLQTAAFKPHGGIALYKHILSDVLSAANIANPSETSKGNAGKFSLRLQDAINETDTEPTEAQKKSGNYKKGHVKFGGYDYTIENPKGSYRSGVDENGKEWKQKMNDTYGYIRGKFGKDGDHLDMFINDKADLDSWNGDVFVVDQVNQDGTFDEHKVMYGYDSLDEAKKAYLSNYEKGWTGLGNITPVSKAGFDKWLDKSNRKLKPFADYADITSKTNMDTAPSSFEEFLEHPAVRYSIRNEKERAAAEDAYNFAQENRPDRYSRYAIVNMEKPGAVPQYLEKKAVADNWRRYYNKLKWGNYKLFDLDKPFEDNVKNLVGKFPETFRKKNDTTLSKINELTADYNKRKEEYDAMSNSIQELLNGLMKQGRSLAEAESVIRDWGLYKEMDSKYQNLMGIRKQLNELRSGKVADGERYFRNEKERAAAVVPDNLGEDVRKGIENAGLPMYDYDPTKEGDRSRAFNEAINSSDNIRFSLKSMMEKPEGWKQANKKAIHIAEAIERDPKFSLKNLDGTLIKAGTYFSGGGLVEEGLKGIIDPVVAVEYDEKISGVYRNNFGNHIVTADVRDVDPKELVGKIDGEVEYFHASPVCKNYSLAKNNHEELELDKETAASTAEFISKVRPKVVTIENVKGYKDSEAMKTITDALDEAGYKWDADVYNAADYGGYTNRERLIVRAVRDGELPAKPEKQKRKSGWYEAVEDIMPTLTEKKNGVAPWMDERLKADGIDWRHIDKPLYVMGSGYANGTVPHAFADELLPTLRTKSGDVIVMPDGKVYRAMGRVLARVSGVSDDYQMPASEALSHTIIGNGIPTQLTENVIAPLVRDVLHPEVEEKASLKDADRKQTQLDIILKTNPMLDDYHTGIRKVEDIKTLGESVEEARSEAEKYGYDEWSAYPDITNDMLQNALETGEITIYSSKPIKNGVFVTPSYMQASDYAGGGNVYEKTVPLTDVAWINTDEGQYAKVDGERYSLKEVNDKFNDRLAQLIENPNQKDRVLHLGRSSQFLIDGGIADAEIELDFDKFVRKSSEKYKNNHPFSAGDIKDLPKAIAYPVAVFNSTTKKDHVVMTELNHDGKNFIVAIRATEQNRKNKVVLEVNQITSLYPKGERGIIYWINNNKLSNVDKEKALHFIEALQPHAGTLTSEELSSAANIVRNFVNPKQNDGNLQKTERYSLRVDRYRDELNQWKKDNNLPKDAERPQLPVREPNDRLGFT